MNRIVILIFLGVFRKRELAFGFAMVFTSHVDGGKVTKESFKSALYLKGLDPKGGALSHL